MKKITLVLVVLLFTSCGVTQNSVVDSINKNPAYSNVIMAMPYRKFETKNYINNLKEGLEKVFLANNKKIEIITFEKEPEGLKLNQTTAIEQLINSKIQENSKDLLLVLKPTKLVFTNGGLQDFQYEIVGIDTDTQKEVWKGEFRVRGQFGPSTYLKKSVEAIYAELIAKGML